ncbi:MAG: Rhs element Vgr protein, partial [Candidatus Electrothrix sp. EH2]|nr:Rhs element Vgr protein [Candidatus Electrothrix sp. EH2]
MVSSESVIPTPATPDVCTVGILIDGSEIPGEFHLLSVAVTREVNRIPSAVVQFQDGEAAKATFAASGGDYFIPGKKIEIQL